MNSLGKSSSKHSTTEKLVKILGYLGGDIEGLKYNDDEIFSLIVVAIVSIKSENSRLVEIVKSLRRQLLNLSWCDGPEIAGSGQTGCGELAE